MPLVRGAASTLVPARRALLHTPLPNFLTARNIPKANRAVAGAAGQQLAVGRVSNALDLFGVAFEQGILLTQNLFLGGSSTNANFHRRGLFHRLAQLYLGDETDLQHFNGGCFTHVVRIVVKPGKQIGDLILFFLR